VAFLFDPTNCSALTNKFRSVSQRATYILYALVCCYSVIVDINYAMLIGF